MSDWLTVAVEVVEAQRLTPHFARIRFRAPAHVGGAGPAYDQRIRVGIPSPGCDPWVADGDDWYSEWLASPEAERGQLRTYSVRDIDRRDDETLITVDFVLHFSPGCPGVASEWAEAAQPGDRASMILPRRGLAGAGIEFAPGPAAFIVLAGDETAAPAIARILEDLPRDSQGYALIEIPAAADELPIDAPSGFEVRWLARDDREHGDRLVEELLDVVSQGRTHAGVGDLPAYDEGELVWETPTFSALGEDLDEPREQVGETFYWVAGECRVVAGLRRRLVREFGVARKQIAFMGYWKR